jgi:hypothetical protein
MRSVRAVFWLYLSMILVGIVYFSALGLMGR